MPGGVSPPPCIWAKVFQCIAPSNATGVTLGVWRLTSDQTGHKVPADARIKVRFWLYVMPWVASTQTMASSLVLDVSLGNHDVTFPTIPVSASRERFTNGPIEAVGCWIPVRGLVRHHSRAGMQCAARDTLFPDTADIDALLRVFSGGPCS